MAILDVVLIVNVVLKFAGVVDWTWSFTLWPLWVIIMVLIFRVLFDD